jgi:predicted RNase H-like HicB family nuclease
MLLNYIRAAMQHAEYKKLDNGDWFAEIPGFDGVWADAPNVETCRGELEEVLGEWLLLKIRDGDPLPVIDSDEADVEAYSLGNNEEFIAYMQAVRERASREGTVSLEEMCRAGGG